MNAPVTATIDTIDTYSKVLPEKFIEETKQRNRIIEHNKITATNCIEKITKDYTAISREIDGLKNNLHQLSDSYSELAFNCMQQKKSNQNLAESMKEFSDNLRMTAATIRRNLNR